jgi:hypothetical protein
VPEVASLIIMKITRLTNGGVENTNDVFGLSAGLHFQANGVGTLNKAPNFYE